MREEAFDVQAPSRIRPKNPMRHNAKGAHVCAPFAIMPNCEASFS